MQNICMESGQEAVHLNPCAFKKQCVQLWYVQLKKQDRDENVVQCYIILLVNFVISKYGLSVCTFTKAALDTAKTLL